MPNRSGSDWIWPYDQYDPAPAKRARGFQDMLSFEAPRHSSWLGRIAHLANRLYLRVGNFGQGAIIPVLPKDGLAKLKAIPRGAGNMLVGTHPGPLDSYLMFHLMGAGHRGPVVFLMASEAYFGGSRWRRLALNRLGVIPVARGRKNPDAVRHMSQLVARGWWGGIFPEGEVYFSRDVMPMEYGAVRIVVETALDVQRQARETAGSDGEPRPIFLTPFSHVYFLKDPAKAMHRAEDALRELEANPMISIDRPSGDLLPRLRSAADRLLNNKAIEYGIPPDEWDHGDRFERNRKLQDAVLKRMEMDYLGRIEDGFPRRRAMKVRMACYERLADDQLSPEARDKAEKDVKKTRELILMTPFSSDYREKYDDPETLIEYLRRFRSALSMPYFNFGSQVVHFAVHEPIDLHPIALEYASLKTEKSRRDYLYEKTQSVREIVQSGVDAICSSRPATQ